MRHVVADAVRREAQREFRQIAGAEHQRVVLVGEPEQVRGALACLHVLERDVVHRLALGVRMADVLQHALRRRADVDLRRANAERAHQRVRIVEGLACWCAKPGIV